MKTYILLDAANLFFRSRHVVRGDIDTKLGMSLHIVFSSIKKAWSDFNGDHLVIFLEGRSWRKDFYKPYKQNRKETKAAMTEKEQEEDKLFWEMFEDFKNFMCEKTNVSVLQNSVLEADDLISGWIKNHPDDQHVIISTDGDFMQLISPNVKQYNGVTGITITETGFWDQKNKPVIDKKTKKPKDAPDPDWLLFEKCIRGDTSDNIFSAYPGVRTKGTKNKTGMVEAFADKKTKGFNWNNLMLQRWVDHEGVEHRVLDDYNRNVLLCDLRAQPEHIKEAIDQTVNSTETKNISQIGVKFMKFCAKWDLRRLVDQAQVFGKILSSSYEK